MLTTHERRKLALEALTSERTVQRAYTAPASVRESTLLRLTRAARKLRLPEPPASSEQTATTMTELAV